MNAPLPLLAPQADWVTVWNQTSRQLRRLLNERYCTVGLSESRAAILLAIAASTRSFTQSNLATDLSLSESNLCSLIERMRTEGLLERERSLLDRRKSVLTLTQTGRELCDAISQIHQRFQLELLTLVPPEFHSLLPATFPELGRALDAIELNSSLERRAAS